MAQQHLQAEATHTPAAVAQPSPLSATDWQTILEKLYDRKKQEQLVLAEGDPRRYRDLAASMAQPSDGV
jgi:phycocyanobilin lyase beta subunit